MQSSNLGALSAAGSGEAAHTTPEAPDDPAGGRGPQTPSRGSGTAALAILCPMDVS